MSTKPSHEAIIKAWVDPGINPSYHEAMKSELRQNWPVLANALDLAAVEDVVQMANGDKPWKIYPPRATERKNP